MNNLVSFFWKDKILRNSNNELIVFIEFNQLFEKIENLKNNFWDDIYFIWEFLREISSSSDEFILVFKYLKQLDLIIISQNPNSEALPLISSIFPAADLFQKEIYDNFWKDTLNWQNYILRLHTYKKDFFPMRVLGKAMVKEKKPFRFKTLPSKDVVTVPVWPIHAWIIPPGHFRFIVDGEDTLNLDIQLWFLHRGVEKYFNTEKDLNNLKVASEEIVWDSVISHGLTFVRAIESLSWIKISERTRLNRVILLELERIYNHLWTVGAIHNDVWQGFLLNWMLSIRESILDAMFEVYWSRVLKNILNFGSDNLALNESQKQVLKAVLQAAKTRFTNQLRISESSAWIYDRLKDTWIVHKKTAFLQWALWLWAKASWIDMDYRQFDPYYKDFDVKVNLWEQWDSYDRMIVRAREIIDSIDLILSILENPSLFKWEKSAKMQVKLKPNEYVFSKTEWHRWEILHIAHTNDKWEIDFYKIKDPSFLNWTLIEYAVLKNIIADFPICNKSYDLSYAGFDL